MLKLFEVEISEDEIFLNFNDDLLQVISRKELDNILDEVHQQKLKDVVNYVVVKLRNQL